MKDYSELRLKIIYGVELAIKRLIEEKAKNNENMIITQDGKIVSIPARQILQEQIEEENAKKQSAQQPE